MTDLFPINRADKITCLKREISMRRRVYPRWIESGKMKQETADREIALMEAILADFEATIV